MYRRVQRKSLLDRQIKAEMGGLRLFLIETRLQYLLVIIVDKI